MTQQALEQGLDSLESLSREEYCQPLAQVVGDPSPRQVFRRVGRLVGVKLKQPFADAKELKPPSAATGAYRAWELVDEDEFRNIGETSERQVLNRLRDEGGYRRQYTTFDLARDSRHERGFFALLAGSVADHICDDTEISDNVGAGHQRFLQQSASTAAGDVWRLIDSDATALESLLKRRVPALEVAGPSLVAGTVLLLYAVGMKSFCEWSREPWEVPTEVE